ncbi:hypothetical protein ZOSMA_25G00670 [Zostera marina]|uniref:Uncharacterized protein n=1 Tax=Zostera marina TaxID=29655 RepID=A0A0K9PHI5_ZOSMR|nr:hypothetical protein ZOSMA_25G00670 [Zostera marina]
MFEQYRIYIWRRCSTANTLFSFPTSTVTVSSDSPSLSLSSSSW